jgi:hypothetical protein
MGSVFIKAAYRGFTDETFTSMKVQDQPTDGLLGPYIHAEVGDEITVIFKVGSLFTSYAHHKSTRICQPLAV